jgi:phage-related protein
MKWRIEIHPKGKEEIEALSLKMRAKLEHILNLLQDYGLSYVYEPYVKHLQNELWEIRVKDKDGIARVVYILANKKRIVLLHAFVKKTQKTPKVALEIAVKRIREVENE